MADINTHNINNFRSRIGWIARPTLFDLFISSMPGLHNGGTSSTSGGADVTNDVKFTCRATSIPSSSIGEIDVKYFGRSVFYAGDRTYDPWTVTIIGMNDWKLYKYLLDWHQAINHPLENKAANANMRNFKRAGTVRVYDQVKNKTLEINLDGLWPTRISEVRLGWDLVDQPVDIEVTWRFDWISEINPSSLMGGAGVLGG